MVKPFLETWFNFPGRLLFSPHTTIIRQKNEKSKGKILKKFIFDFIFAFYTLSNIEFWRVCLIKIFLIFFGKFLEKNPENFSNRAKNLITTARVGNKTGLKKRVWVRVLRYKMRLSKLRQKASKFIIGRSVFP